MQEKIRQAKVRAPSPHAPSQTIQGAKYTIAEAITRIPIPLLTATNAIPMATTVGHPNPMATVAAGPSTP